MADTLILMVLALVVFGPRRLPQIGRQIGKLMYEFRKASNDFKFQMEEELRHAEEADAAKRKKRNASARWLPLPGCRSSSSRRRNAAEFRVATEHPRCDPNSSVALPRRIVIAAPAAKLQSRTRLESGPAVESQRNLQPPNRVGQSRLARLRIQPPSTGKSSPRNPPAFHAAKPLASRRGTGAQPQQQEPFAARRRHRPGKRRLLKPKDRSRQPTMVDPQRSNRQSPQSRHRTRRTPRHEPHGAP